MFAAGPSRVLSGVMAVMFGVSVSVSVSVAMGLGLVLVVVVVLVLVSVRRAKAVLRMLGLVVAAVMLMLLLGVAGCFICTGTVALVVEVTVGASRTILLFYIITIFNPKPFFSRPPFCIGGALMPVAVPVPLCR